MRTQRFYKIPLCKKDCDSWFDACKNDWTCRDNWNKGFRWINRTNYCPEHERCVTFKNKFKTAENFCSSIWDNSFEVEKDPKKCITFEFELDSYTKNPNQKVAEYYSELAEFKNVAINSFFNFSLIMASLAFFLAACIQI
jgi:folate receptor